MDRASRLIARLLRHRLRDDAPARHNHQVRHERYRTGRHHDPDVALPILHAGTALVRVCEGVNNLALLQSQRMRSRPGTSTKMASADTKPAAMCSALVAIHKSLAWAGSASGCPAWRQARRSSATRVKSASLTGTTVASAIASSSRSRRGVPHSATSAPKRSSATVAAARKIWLPARRATCDLKARRRRRLSAALNTPVSTTSLTNRVQLRTRRLRRR